MIVFVIASCFLFMIIAAESLALADALLIKVNQNI